MKPKKYFLFLIFFLFLALILTTSVSSQLELPIGMQKIIDYNNESTANFSLKISFLIAFVAGVLSILSPCILPFLPAYFSYTFKEKKNITKMTGIFFLGFSLVFVTMGVIAGFIGSQVLSILQSGWLVTIAGLFIIFLGVISLLGKGFSSFIKLNSRLSNDVPGTFLLGIFFAAGWTACLGPILAGILGMGAILGNIGYSALLLFFYSLGILVPLFILSMFYDKFNLSKSKLIRGKLFVIQMGIKKWKIHSTNLISGILFIIIGVVMVIYKGTSIVNNWDILGTKPYFYSIQNKLMGWQYANLLGMILLLLFIIIVSRFLWKNNKNNNQNNKINN